MRAGLSFRAQMQRRSRTALLSCRRETTECFRQTHRNTQLITKGGRAANSRTFLRLGMSWGQGPASTKQPLQSHSAGPILASRVPHFCEAGRTRNGIPLTNKPLQSPCERGQLCECDNLDPNGTRSSRQGSFARGTQHPISPLRKASDHAPASVHRPGKS